VPAQDREVIRLVPPVALWWLWVVFVVANVADYAIQGLPSAATAPSARPSCCW
jgi:hypothetical protein